MITVEEALSIIESAAQDYGTEDIPLEQGLGRILREKIVADRDFPPYDRVTMDGIAISFDKFQSGQRKFMITGVAPAGSPKITIEDNNNCMEVMTGALVPGDLDTVIPYEVIQIENNHAQVNIDDVSFRQNIHFKGIDRKKGDVVIYPGVRISPSEIGVCSTVGKSKIAVSKLPKTIIISSGDELVDIDQSPLPYQIRKSNVHRIKTVLKHNNVEVDTDHLPDDYHVIVEKLKSCLAKYDVIIVSGGVSKGKFDYLPSALEEVGVKKLFHRIQQRPGKPFWFGKSEKGVTVFAFPGNPVSSFMCMQYYFVHWLNTSLQSKVKELPRAKLGEDVHFEPDLTYFLEVRIETNMRGEVIASPAKGNGSGDLANLVDADAFIILPKGNNYFYKGEVYPYLVYR